MRFLESTRAALEGEIEGHQSRIASLEKSRNGLEETLRLTEIRLQHSAAARNEMQSELKSKAVDFAQLQKEDERKNHEIKSLVRNLEVTSAC